MTTSNSVEVSGSSLLATSGFSNHTGRNAISPHGTARSTNSRRRRARAPRSRVMSSHSRAGRTSCRSICSASRRRFRTRRLASASARCAILVSRSAASANTAGCACSRRALHPINASYATMWRVRSSRVSDGCWASWSRTRSSSAKTAASISCNPPARSRNCWKAASVGIAACSACPAWRVDTPALMAARAVLIHPVDIHRSSRSTAARLAVCAARS